MPGDVEVFVRSIAPVLDTYRSIDVRLVASRYPDGKWRVLRLRALLTPEESIELCTDLPAVPDLLVVHERWPASAMDVLMTGLSTGELTFGGNTIYIKQDRGNQTWDILNYYTRDHDRVTALSEFQIDWRTWALGGYGSISNTGLWYAERDRLNAVLRNGTPPWDGLRELFRGFIGEATPPSELNDIRSWILAPLPVRIKDIKVGPALSMEVQCSGTVRPSEASVAVLFGMEGRTVARNRVTLDNAAKVFAGLRTLSIPLPREFSGIVSALTYRGLDAERRELFQKGEKGPSRAWSILAPVIGAPEDFMDASAS